MMKKVKLSMPMVVGLVLVLSGILGLLSKVHVYTLFYSYHRNTIGRLSVLLAGGLVGYALGSKRWQFVGIAGISFLVGIAATILQSNVFISISFWRLSLSILSVLVGIGILSLEVVLKK